MASFRTERIDFVENFVTQSSGCEIAERIRIRSFTASVCGLRKPLGHLNDGCAAIRLKYRGILWSLSRVKRSFQCELRCACSVALPSIANEEQSHAGSDFDRKHAESIAKLSLVRAKTGPNRVERTRERAIALQADQKATIFDPRKSFLHQHGAGIVSYFEQLGITDYALRRCLKQASDLSEEDIMRLMATFGSLRVKRGNLRSLLSKHPPILKVKPAQVELVSQYFSLVGFGKGNLIKLWVQRPTLIDSDLERTKRIIDHLLCLGVQTEDLPIILLKRPQILEVEVELIQDTTQALFEAGVSQTDLLRLLKRVPEIFSPSVHKHLHANLSFWASLGVNGKALSRALLRRPRLLSYSIASMKTTHQFLQQWMPPGDLNKLVIKYAELLAFDPKKKLEPLIMYFLKLGVKKNDIGKIVCRRPQLMATTIPGLKKTVEYLKSLGVKEEMLGKVITMSPQVFTLNAEEKLKQSVEFFQSIGLDKERDMEFLFSRNAQVLCCSIEKNLQPKLEFFLNTGLRKEDVAKMVVLFPSMLGHNIDSLRPKHNYLVEVMKRSIQEVVDFPQYFGYSLENRIKPRHEKLAQREIYTSLPSMLACTDHDFHTRYMVKNHGNCRLSKAKVKD